jgi:hypothetical protein
MLSRMSETKVPEKLNKTSSDKNIGEREHYISFQIIYYNGDN